MAIYSIFFPLNNGHKSMSCFPRIKH